jgi:hypothetical protein
MLRHCAHHRSSSPPRPAATRVKRKMCRLVTEADLLHERDEVVHEVLLHDLAIVPEGDRAEVNLERLAGGGISSPSGPFIGPVMVPVKWAIEQVQSPEAKKTL